jgi:type III secretion system HrpE/YscL family protein
MLAVAEQEAARILLDAQRLRDEQASLGYDEGYKKGYEEALAKLGEIEEDVQKTFEGLEPKLVMLSVKVAEKIIGQELATRPDTIAAIVAQALKTVRHQREVNVRVHPSHAAALEAHKKTLLGVLSRARDVVIRPDPSIREGGCVIETELGILDADLRTQLEILERALGGGVPKPSAEQMAADVAAEMEEGDAPAVGEETHH